ncbi:MAG: sensor domain-containing diguanylate cyclase [Candidatus Aureabacteria bacterium]|nr:sensor domain-containing diguanylate cyclase [Candidatus Auribacterota bacterium]
MPIVVEKEDKQKIWGTFTIILALVLSLAIFIFNRSNLNEFTFFFCALLSGFWIVVLSSWIAFGNLGSLIFLSLSILVYTLLLLQPGRAFVHIYLFGIIFFWFILIWYMTDFNSRSSDQNITIENKSEELNKLINENTEETNKNKALKNKIESFSKLSNVIRELSFTISIDEVLDKVTTYIFQMLDKGDICSLYLLNDNMRSLDFKRYLLRNMSKSIMLNPKTKNIFNIWVLQHRQPLIVNDIDEDYRFDLSKGSTKRPEWLKSLISAPLITGNKIIGIVRIDSTEKENFTIDDLRLLMILANMSALIIQNAILYKKTEDLAIRDDLTGLFVPRIFHERIKLLVKQNAIAEKEEKFSILMIDLDHFKALNDEHGHVIGDLVLKKASAIVKDSISSDDLASRFGGEEFSVILVNKNHEEAYDISERIRKTVENRNLTVRRKKISLTLSIGISTYPDDALEGDKLIKIADERLYKAKELGRNKVI